MSFNRSSVIASSAALVIAITTLANAEGAQGEAPALAELVAAGELPPAAERTGPEPRIVEPVKEVGTFCGTHRAALVGGTDRNMLLKFTGYEPLIAWDREWLGELVPNMASSFEVSDDARSFTFTLREGMKWSNGSPFTANDVAFMINDIVGDPQFDLQSKHSWLQASGKFATATAVSDTELLVEFEEPNGLFLQNAATPNGMQLTLMSMQYCSQFMPKFNDGAEELAREAGAVDWIENLRNRCGLEVENIERWRNPEMPTLNAFMIEQPYESGATQVTMVRNPYYWKVDPEGNQLPYIDDARFSINADKQTALLAAVSGETTFQQRHIANSLNLPVLAQAQEFAGMRVVPRVLDRGADNTIAFNLSHPDEAKRDIFDDVEFRAALSHGIDRKAMIEGLYLGLGEPTQPGPPPSSP